jgi:formylglycine-generating enzyme required for sulfatase activity
MRINEITRIQCVIGMLLCFRLTAGFSADLNKGFRISAVQENQIWIEGGLLDGLAQGMEGEIRYEISIAGQKKRIVPAKVRLSKTEDRESIGILYEQVGIINIGYSACFSPKPAGDLLLFLNKRASEAYVGKDFKLAQQYYQRILEVLPDDAFARQKIKDCESQIEKLSALLQERNNIPYYREVIRVSFQSGDPESLKLAQTYLNKILAAEPEDAESLKLKEKLAQPVAELNRTKQVPDLSHAPLPEVEEAKPAELKPAPAILTEAPPEMGRSSLENMIQVPEGDYWIGSPPERSPFNNETPKHLVHLASYYLDKHEVTNEEYKKFCDMTGRPYPSYFTGSEFPPGSARRPVVMVSWADADEYARWSGKRLPTEAEWEAAAAGFSGKTWPWGNTWIPNLANTREKGEYASADVASHPLDVSEFGIHDMAGNVSEWTHDFYKPYPGNAFREKEYGEQFKVLRGGSSQASKEFARAQFRARLPESFRSMDLGFRCASSEKK